MPITATKPHTTPHQPLAAPEIMTVAWLLKAARDCTGLNVLLMLGQDPMLCETARGFAIRLNRPVCEVESVLSSLQDSGVLCSSRASGEAGRVSYWLAEDPRILFVLRRLLDAYMSGASHRGDLLRGLPTFQTA